jgi:NADH-quinone oxidoreductase subunit J
MNPPIEYLGFAIAFVTLAAAVMVVTSKVPIHAACFLILTLFGVGAEFVVLEAHTIAVFQVLVYAGAIVVLITFVMMLMGSGPKDQEPVFLDNWRSIVGLVLSVLLLGLFGYTLSIDRVEPASTPVNAEHFGSLESLGRALLTDYVFPFEVISILLLVAIVGAVALLRKAPPPADGEEAQQ